MGLYKRGKTWWIDYYYPPGRGGKRIRERVGPDKDEARIELAARLRDIRQGRNPELRHWLEENLEPYELSLNMRERRG